MTRREQYFVNAYSKAKYTSIKECYHKPSDAKIAAEQACLDKMDCLEGWGFRVISFNPQFFTCGYKYKVGDDEYLNVETKDTTYIILLREGA